MRHALMGIVLAATVAAQTPDPASLMSTDIPIFFEVQDLSGIAALLQKSPLFSAAESRAGESQSKLLEDLILSGTRTFALGISPATIGPHEWIALVESKDPAGALALIRSRRAEPVLSATIPPYLVVASSEKALGPTMGLAKGDGKSLLDRADFKAFRTATGTEAPVRFHLDVQQMWPRALRSVKNSSNIWSVLLGCHVNHVLKTLGTLSGSMTTTGGLKASIRGDIRATDSRAVTEGNPAQSVIAPPPGTAFQVSVPRNLSYFWARRSNLVPDSTESRLAKLEARVGSVMPDWTVERLLGQLGEAFDLYILPGEAASDPGKSFPALALIGVSAEPSPPTQVDALGTFFGLVNGAFSEEDAAPPDRRAQGQAYRGVELLISESGGPAVVAKVKGRIIIANQAALAMRLVDAALDGEPLPRSPGDQIVAFGPSAARLIRDSKTLFSSGWLAERSGSETRAREILDGAERFFGHVQELRVRFDLSGPQVSLEAQVVAPGLLGADSRASPDRR